MALRSPRPFLRLVLIACCAVAAAAQATAPEILQYKDGSSSRQESGQPGKNVTGQWSWVDANGRNHRIWYIADEFGFQAFGDLVPPVGQEIPSPTPEESLRKAVDQRIQPEAFLQSASHGSDPADEDTHRSRTPSQADSIPQGVSQSSSKSLKSGEDSGSSTSTSGSRLGAVSVLELLTNQDRSRKETSESPSRSKVLDSNIISTDKSRSRGSTKFMSSEPKKENSQTETKSNSFSLDSLGSDPKLPNAPKIAKMISGDLAGNIQDLFHSDLPNPISGTRFVLVDRLQPPTIPKSRTIPSPIRPRPVTNKGPITVISGVHTSSRSKSLATNFIGSTKTLPPHLTRGKAVGRESVVPQPLKVEGNLNLENFFSPINLAKTTPAPFELGSLDDYYYDYDYYDYPASELEADSTSSNTSVSNTTSPDTINPIKISLGETIETTQIITSTTARMTTTTKATLSSTQAPTPVPIVKSSTQLSSNSETSHPQDTEIQSGLANQSPSSALPSFPPNLFRPAPSSSSSRGNTLRPFLSAPVTSSPPTRLPFSINRAQKRPFSRVTSASHELMSDEDDCDDSDDSHESGGEQDD